MRSSRENPPTPSRGPGSRGAATRQSRLQTRLRPPGPVFDPSESAFANRFQALGETPSALYAPECPFCSGHQGPLLDRKESLYLAPETLKGTDALPIPLKDQKGSNFIEPYKKKDVSAGLTA